MRARVTTCFVSALLLSCGGARADEAKDLVKNVFDATSQLMVVAYGCRGELGGIAQYQAARTIAELTEQHFGVTRDQAVLDIDKIEISIKGQLTDDAVAKMGMDSLRCQEVVAEGQHAIDLASAKLNLFLKSHRPR